MESGLRFVDVFENSSEPSMSGDGGEEKPGIRAVGSLGWLIAFWPLMTVPSASPADM